MLFQHHSLAKKTIAEKKELAISKENITILLVWHPKVNGKNATAMQVFAAINKAKRANAKDGADRRADVEIGHVAMRTPNRYISIWPGESAGGSRFKVVKAIYSDLETDLISEGRKPDTIVCLYSLNTVLMEKLYDQVTASDAGFRLAGDTSIAGSHDAFWSSEKKGDSCCGLVFHILKEGGIEKITPLGKGSEFAFYISPDRFDSYIKTVKAEELKKHPETADFKEPEGTYQPPKIRLSKFL